jgi:hypothetical protein
MAGARGRKGGACRGPPGAFPAADAFFQHPPRHHRSLDALICDGHVEALRSTDLQVHKFFAQ